MSTPEQDAHDRVESIADFAEAVNEWGEQVTQLARIMAAEISQLHSELHELRSSVLALGGAHAALSALVHERTDQRHD